MNNKKKVHIISHSHLDREWYLPLVEHQMYLVDLIDNIIKLSEDKRFNSFHLDGQIIPLEDYFKIKPQNREKVENLIKNNKLRIGPFYILQDDFLISSESNLRNFQVGKNETLKYINGLIDDHMYIGYFPDTFGNAGQIPQILKRANCDIAYFGRGVKATGFNNEVFEDYTSKNSEMYWESPDGSKVLGVLFANWYSNGNEIPVDKDKAKIFWDKKLKDVEKFSSTNHLLMMNGCDHQPVQMDVLDAIDVANELYEEYEFIHSNLNDYRKEILKELKEKNIYLNNIKGELRSQNTDGWWTLQGTSSNRVYLKKANKECEYLLEEVVEPLLTSIYDKKDYPYEKINYAWKTLLSNHPHDSICGCGIDSIHKGMEERFKEVNELSNHLIKQSLVYYRENVDTRKYTKNEYLFTLHNMTQYEGLKETEVIIDLEKIYFKDMYFEDIYNKLSEKEMPKSAKIYYNNILVYETNLKNTEIIFDYDLPKDRFRDPYFARRIKFRFKDYLNSFERKTYEVKFSNEIIETKSLIKVEDNIIKTKFYDIEILKNGTFNVFDKETNIKYGNLAILENTGDVGNEYIFKEAICERIYSNKNISDYKIRIEDDETVIVEILDKIKIPKCADNSLIISQKKLESIVNRQIKRSTEFVELEILKTLEIKNYSKTLKLNIKYENKAKDHRLRILFENGIKSENVYAESIYEVAKRNIIPSIEWKNPDNSQNLNRFVNLKNEFYGITLGTDAIAEYEVIENNTLCLTLGRYTGELGDWGYFPTNDSQGLREHNLNIYIDFHNEDYILSYHRVIEKRKKYISSQIFAGNEGYIKPDDNLNIDASNLFVTALKRNYLGEKIVRVCNYLEEKYDFKSDLHVEFDILEEKIIDFDKKSKTSIKGYEIRTFGLEN